MRHRRLVEINGSAICSRCRHFVIRQFPFLTALRPAVRLKTALRTCPVQDG
jgi:hypothetical protein